MEFSRRKALKLGGVGVAAFGFSGRQAASAAPDPVVATTGQGAVRGVRDGEVIVWKGVRFAEAPTGEYRFAPPRPARRWDGIRDATEFGPEPFQAAKSGRSPAALPQAEDCLFLNVYSRSTDGRRPVIVWITGGGFMSGAGSQYDGAVYPRRQDVVFVTVNYRVNTFGYLYQPDRPGSGNLGLLDQIAALRWVRDNITAFGGDPDNVTVMGESAGGMSIGILLGTPAAKGLFRRAIVQSGGSCPTVMPEGKDYTTTAVLRAVGLGENDAAKLIDVPAPDLLAAATRVHQRADDADPRSAPFHPLIDHVVLSRHPLDLIGDDVDLLVGTCDKEQIPGPTWESQFEFNLRHAAGDEGWNRLLKAYTETSAPGRDPRLDLLASAFVDMPSTWLAERASHAGAQVWQYTFDYADAGRAGALHGTDVPFTFGAPTPEMLAPGADPAVAQQLADRMVDAFSAFAKTGDPATPALPPWPAFTPQDRATLSFDTNPHITNDRLPARRREAWAGINPYTIC